MKLSALSLATKTLVLTILSATIHAAAQEKAVYRSEADDLITVRKVAILPVFDNLRGIYSRPVESFLIEQLKDNHHFEMAEATTTGPILTPEEIEEDPNLVKNISQNLQADAFIASKVVKGPSGLSIRMSLFLTKDQKLLAREEAQGIQRLDVETVKKQAAEVMNKLFERLPYEGVVLSRQGTRVTVNLGKKDGIVPEQMISVLQIVKLNRHPKFNFLVGTEKEIIGKIKLLKIDDTLSFGRIVTEKETGSIQVNAKIGGLDSVVYTNTDSLSETKSTEDSLLERPDGKASFGEKPLEWLPQKTPTFGQVGARLGIGSFNENISAGGTSLDSKNPFYPFIVIDGEIWLTPKWSMHAQIKQGIISTDNPTGGSPKDLSRSLSAYEFLMGYNIRLGAGVWSPKVELLGGYSTSRLYTDDTNSAVTTKTYGGMKLGVSGLYPLQDDAGYAVGANLFFFLEPRLSESPSFSGNGDHDIKQFGLFVDKKLKVNVKARFGLDFEMFSSDFGGGAVTSASQKHTTVSGGLYYMF